MPQSSGRRVDPSRFSMVPRSDVPRSAFDVQHVHKTTFDASYLVPVYVDEVLPGDSHRVRMTALARLATPLVPAMDNIILESFFFFVPNRLVWSNWERFMGEQSNPTDTTVFLTPYVLLDETYITVGTLYDYFGLTVNNDVNASLQVTTLPLRGYNLVYNEFFRDQDIQTQAANNTGDGPDSADDYILRTRGKRHDYFTTARPWPQKPMNIQDFSHAAMSGVTTPGGRMLEPTAGAPVSGLGVLSTADSTVAAQTIKSSGGRLETLTPNNWNTTDDAFYMKVSPSGNPDVRLLVNDLRTAVMVQGFIERNARGGTRYTELVRSHFGVTSADARLQRPEYLGGGKSFIQITPIAQTSASGVAGTTTSLGDQAAVGAGVANGHGFSQSFTEHGWIIGIMNIRADLTYQNGVNRMWFRRTQFDFYWPALAHLGEQAILTKEIYCTGVAAADQVVFGYQERWAEYKYKPSRTSGFMRSAASGTLDRWHFAQQFTAAPTLNGTFISDGSTTPIARSQVTSGWAGEQFLLDMMFDVRMVRAMPMYSIPGVGARL